MYLGQAVLRGDPIYADTFLGYPPLAPLLSAASMAIGGAFGLPSWLAPRYAGVGVASASALALFALTRRATGSAWAGALAGCVLVGFSHLARLSVANLEPKMLVVLFGLLSGLALQRRRSLEAGLWACLAALCWQPAGISALAGALVTARAGRGERGRRLGRFFAGAGIGLLPALVYLGATGTWRDFWLRAFVIPASLRLPELGSAPGSWLEVARLDFATELVFFATGALGFLVFAAAGLRRGLGRCLRHALHPRLAGLPVTTLLWAGLDSVEFGGPPDMLPILPALAFWSAWASRRGVAQVALWLRSRAGPRPARRFARASAAALLAAAALYGSADAWRYAPSITLDQQRRLVSAIVASAGPGGEVAGFDASEVYVFDARRSPNRFLSLNRAFSRFAGLVEPQGCRGVIRRLLAERTPVIVIKRSQWQSDCVKRLQGALAQRAYTGREITLRERRVGRLSQDERGLRPVRWAVYWAGQRPSLFDDTETLWSDAPQPSGEP